MNTDYGCDPKHFPRHVYRWKINKTFALLFSLHFEEDDDFGGRAPMIHRYFNFTGSRRRVPHGYLAIMSFLSGQFTREQDAYKNESFSSYLPSAGRFQEKKKSRSNNDLKTIFRKKILSLKIASRIYQTVSINKSAPRRIEIKKNKFSSPLVDSLGYRMLPRGCTSCFSKDFFQEIINEKYPNESEM